MEPFGAVTTATAAQSQRALWAKTARWRAGACMRPSSCPAPRTRRTPSGRRLESITGCDCCFEIIEESLKYPVVKRLDPLAPDRLVFPGSAALDRVADNCRAFCTLQLEPVLALQFRRADNPERTRRPRAIELLPQHQPSVEQAVSLRPWSGSNLRRPDPVEVGDECSDPRRWCRDNPFVKLPDLHPPLTSPPAPSCRRRLSTSPRTHASARRPSRAVKNAAP